MPGSPSPSTSSAGLWKEKKNKIQEESKKTTAVCVSLLVVVGEWIQIGGGGSIGMDFYSFLLSASFDQALSPVDVLSQYIVPDFSHSTLTTTEVGMAGGGSAKTCWT